MNNLIMVCATLLAVAQATDTQRRELPFEDLPRELPPGFAIVVDFKSFDAKKNTITVILFSDDNMGQKKALSEWTRKLAKDVKVLSAENKKLQLTDLKPGMEISIKFEKGVWETGVDNRAVVEIFVVRDSKPVKPKK